MEMRQSATETFAGGKKRKDKFKGDCGKPKRSVSSGSNTIAYLQTKSNMYAEHKTEEIRRR